MVTPENLHEVLMALKDAGVTRARFGDVELVFAPEVAEPLQVFDAPSAPQMPGMHDVEVTRPGYSALFGAQVPRFRPAE